MTQKRYQYWASENGKPVIKWTSWFPCRGEQVPIQHRKLLNEYKQ